MKLFKVNESGSRFCNSRFFFWYILLIRDMVVKRWNRQFGCETIHPTQKFTSMNLLQMTCVITLAA